MNNDLNGKIWIASFVFTNYDTFMMLEMAELQEAVKDKDLDIEFVSFSVDPNNDSPEVLKQYQQQFTDDDTNWHMLTGYTQKEIETFAREEFNTIVQKPETFTQVIHGTNFYLVDTEGFIVNEYNYTDDSFINEIIKEVKKMSK